MSKFVEEFCTKPSFDGDGVQVSSGIGKDGKEYGDPVPMAPPVNYSAPPDVMDMVRGMVRSEQLRQVMDQQGFDTFEEAEDFDVEDGEVDPRTPYEAVFDPKPVPGPQSPETPTPAPGSAAPVPVTAPAEAGVASPPPIAPPVKPSTPT